MITLAQMHFAVKGSPFTGTDFADAVVVLESAGFTESQVDETWPVLADMAASGTHPCRVARTLATVINARPT